MAEEWRPVVGWEAHFQVSNLGRVRRIRSSRNGKAGYVLKPFPNSAKKPRPYFMVNLRSPGRRCVKAVHKIVAEAFLGPCPPGLEANHKDTNKRNNAASNLEYVTRGANIRHSYAHGRRRAFGEGHGRSIITEKQAKDILWRQARGQRPPQIIREMKLAPHIVRKVFNGDTWRHIRKDGVPSLT